MAFITFRMSFTEEDDDTRTNLCLATNCTKAEITVNVNHICAYNSNDITGGTMLRMANGDVYNAPISIKKFREIIEKTETIIPLAEKLSEN